MWKKVFVLLLFIPMVSLSFSTGFVFADPASDAREFNEQGATQLNLGNYEEAILYFNKALQIEPDNIDYLNNMGLALMTQEKYFEAFLFFDRALEIMPSDPTTLSYYNFAQKEMYDDLFGIVDVTIRNSQGHLIGYFRTMHLGILAGDLAKIEIDKFPVTEIVSTNGTDIEVFELDLEIVAENENSISESNYAPEYIEIAIVVSKHLAYQQEPGDRIYVHYKFLRAIE